MWGDSYIYILLHYVFHYIIGFYGVQGAHGGYLEPPSGPRLLKRGENALVNLDPAVLISNIMFMK